jgi:uncharacterized protein (DUF697 family)
MENTDHLHDYTKLHKANDVVKNYIMWTGAAGIIPVPIIDFAAISAIQLNMLNKIGDIYGYKFSSNWGKEVIGSLVGGYLATTLGKGIGLRMVKAIPIIGGIASSLVVPGLAAGSTWALGQIFITHFESGGTLLDFDPKKYKDHFAEMVKKYLAKMNLAKEPVTATDTTKKK